MIQYSRVELQYISGFFCVDRPFCERSEQYKVQEKTLLKF